MACSNKGCKIGIEYTPFKFGLSVYVFGGLNYFQREHKTEDYQGNIYSSKNSKIVEVLDIGFKYTLASW